MGPDPLYAEVTGQIPAQVCATDHWEKSKEAGGGGYHPLVAAIEEAGFEEIGVYITRR